MEKETSNVNPFFGNLKETLQRNSYWISAASFIASLTAIIGFAWTIWHTPSVGDFKFQLETSTSEELIYSATNTGDRSSTVHKIELAFDDPISFLQLKRNRPRANSFSQESTLGRIIRTPHAPSGLPTPDSTGTLFINNSSLHLENSPLENSCDAYSGNLPCEVKPHSPITVTIRKRMDKTSSFELGLLTIVPVYDLTSLLQPSNGISLCIYFDGDKKRCQSDIVLD